MACLLPSLSYWAYFVSLPVVLVTSKQFFLPDRLRPQQGLHYLVRAFLRVRVNVCDKHFPICAHAAWNCVFAFFSCCIIIIFWWAYQVGNLSECAETPDILFSVCANLLRGLEKLKSVKKSTFAWYFSDLVEAIYRVRMNVCDIYFSTCAHAVRSACFLRFLCCKIIIIQWSFLSVNSQMR